MGCRAASRLRKLLEKEIQNCNRTERLRSLLEGKAAMMPEVDAKMATFLEKLIAIKVLIGPCAPARSNF